MNKTHTYKFKDKTWMSLDRSGADLSGCEYEIILFHKEYMEVQLTKEGLDHFLEHLDRDFAFVPKPSLHKHLKEYMVDELKGRLIFNGDGDGEIEIINQIADAHLQRPMPLLRLSGKRRKR